MSDLSGPSGAPGARLLSWPAVREKVGISRTTAWRLQNEGAFPLPVVISAGRVGWREEEIEAWAAGLHKRIPRKATHLARGSGALRLTAPIAELQPSSEPPPGRTSPSQAKPPSAQLGFDF